MGHGTVLELWLSFNIGLPAPDDEMRVAPVPVTLRGRVLLVDDKELVRMSTADMLAELGYDVIEANSAEQALQLFNEGADPDLVVTDHLMPGMSGTELALEMRARTPGLPTLIVSGYAKFEGLAPDLPRLIPTRRGDDSSITSAGWYRAPGWSAAARQTKTHADPR